MTDAALREAIAETRRFLARAEALQACRKPITGAEANRSNTPRYRHYESGSVCIEQSAARRASMDLTRALARLRQS